MDYKLYDRFSGVALIVSLLPLGAQAAQQMVPEADRPAQVQAATPEVPASSNSPLVRIDHFQVKGNTLLAADLIERLLAPYTGEGRSFTDIQRALDALEGAYRSAGYGAVNVATREQDVTEGTVVLEVTESVIGQVSLSGNQYYDKENIRAALPALVEGSTPSAR